MRQEVWVEKSLVHVVHGPIDVNLPIEETRDMIYLDNVLQFLSTEKPKMEIVSENLFLPFCFILSCFFFFFFFE